MDGRAGPNDPAGRPTGVLGVVGAELEAEKRELAVRTRDGHAKEARRGQEGGSRPSRCTRRPSHLDTATAYQADRGLAGSLTAPASVNTQPAPLDRSPANPEQTEPGGFGPQSPPTAAQLSGKLSFLPRVRREALGPKELQLS